MLPITGGQPNPKWDEYNFEEEYDTETTYGKLRITKEQPFGFRRLVLENGITPEKYNSAYTGIYQAREAKDQLIEELKNAQEELRRNQEKSAIKLGRRERSKLPDKEEHGG